MKSLVKIFLLLLFTYTIQAQNEVEITNSSNCTLLVQMYAVTTGTCQFGTVKNYKMSPGMGIAVTAPSGEEWIYSEITSYPYCNGGVALAVGTPMSCSSTCSWGASSNNTVTNNGCNGCLPNVNAEWIDHCNHPGTLHITDF